MRANTIRELAKLAGDAYWSPVSPFTGTLKDAFGQVRGFTLVDDGTVTIALAGTKSVRDARVDGDIIQKKIKGGYVHRGFWKEYESIQDAIAQVLLKNRGKAVRITGHSLGGALAMFAAADASALGAPIQLVTLGCPKGIDRHYKKYFEKLDIDHVRIVHAYDLIPHVPIFGYTQAGKAVVLDDSGERLGSAKSVAHRIVKLGRIFWAWLRGRPVLDHHVTYYIEAIKRWCDVLECREEA